MIKPHSGPEIKLRLIRLTSGSSLVTNKPHDMCWVAGCVRMQPTVQLLGCLLRIASVITCAIIAFRVNLALADAFISKVQLLAAPHIGAGKWSCALYLRQSAFTFAGHFLNSYSHNHNLIAAHCVINHPDLSSNMRSSWHRRFPPCYLWLAACWKRRLLFEEEARSHGVWTLCAEILISGLYVFQ